MRIISCGKSETGLVRQNNEDVWGGLSGNNFFVLADGMGGHLAGEVAAREAVNTLCRYVGRVLLEPGQMSARKMGGFLSQAIKDVNTEIFIMSTASESLQGMGTTLSCLYIHGSQGVVGHVGDSRVYQLRKQRLTMLTHDHSLFSELRDSGRLEEDPLNEHKYKNIITRAIGTDPIVEPDVQCINVELGDLYLLCSDGLTDLLQDIEIEDILQSHCARSQIDLKECADELIASAMGKGGVDNTTVLLVYAGDSDDHEADLP